jgi:hypothetical protein
VVVVVMVVVAEDEEDVCMQYESEKLKNYNI